MVRKIVPFGNGISLSPDGRFVLCLENLRILCVAALENPGIVAKIEEDRQIETTCIGLGGKMGLSGAVDGSVGVWNLRERRLVFRLRAHTQCITGLALSEDDRFALSGSADGTIRVWDLENGVCRLVIPCGEEVSDLDWTRSGLLAYAAGRVARWGRIYVDGRALTGRVDVT